MKKLKGNKVYLLIIFVMAVILLLPYLVNAYHVNDDTSFHIINVIEVMNQLRFNILNPSKVVGDIAHNFGYGTSLFYPPLAHTLIAYVSLLFNSVTMGSKISNLLMLFLSGVTMFYLSKRLSKDNLVALMSAIIYMAFPYHLSDIYVRDAIGESFLFAFTPMIISGIYELFYGNKEKFYFLFIFGYVGGMYSHLTMMIYFTVILVLYLLYKFKDTIKNLKPFIISSIFILLLTSPFLITMIENKELCSYEVFIPGVMAQGIWHSGLQLFSYINVFGDYGSGELKYFMDIVTIIFLIITIINYKKIAKHKYYRFIIYFTLVSVLLSTKLFLWDLLPISMRMVQFPWRFETFAALGISLLAPLWLKNVKKDKIPIVFTSIIVIIAFIYPNLVGRNNNLLNLSKLNYDDAMGWQKEYLPEKTFNNIDYFNSRSSDVLVLAGDLDATVNKNNTPELVFTVTNIDGSSAIELPRLFYAGYTLKDSNGNSINLYEDEYGFMKAYISSNGTYYLEYTGTNIDNLFMYVGYISLFIFIGWRIYEKVKHNHSLL